MLQSTSLRPLDLSKKFNHFRFCAVCDLNAYLRRSLDAHMYDIAIIGGGVNGCGIARDAAGRGLKVLLVEQEDLASGTSAASTKLIHGGLRYLENYEFGLVRDSLKEREVLWAMAPHIIWPLRFVLPHHSGLRPAALIRLGLFLYDHLGGRKLLPASRSIDLKTDEAGLPLKPSFKRGFEYSDCWVEDSRLVVLNALDAADRGAVIKVGTALRSARRMNAHWEAELADRKSGQTSLIEARMLVNAAGPWVGEVLSNRLGHNAASSVRLVKGSHIVVKRLFDHKRAYIFQNTDKRVIFAIPYESDYTLIGTTDVEYSGDPADVKIEAEEISYMCEAVSAYLKTPVKPDDVVWTYSGVRPLYDDGGEAAQKVTRDFVLELDKADEQAPLLSVFGGKITTYRHLAEEALKKLGPWMKDAGPAWTKGATLPGGDFGVDEFDTLVDGFAAAAPDLPRRLLTRLARAYGTRAAEFLKGCKAIDDLGQCFGADLYEREVIYLVKSEWARRAADILWRRSKLGLRLNAEEVEALDGWLQSHASAIPASAA
jgi:glycerol-3-phosphate dehydrogenase